MDLKRRCCKILIIFLTSIFSCVSYSPKALGLTENFYECFWVQNFENDVRRDFDTYFQPDNLLQFGNFFVAAAILANTGLDRSIRNLWIQDFRSKSSNQFFVGPKSVGGLSYLYFPIYLGAMGVGYWRDHDCFGNVLYQWGYRNLRAFLVGGLQQIILAPTLGSGRPCKNQPSKWQPYRYKAGVSGHAFFGGLPFITAAMMTDPPALRFLLYAVSTLPGISRINSDAHYASQVLLGWTLAYFSARAIYESDQAREPAFQVTVFPKEDGAMVGARWEF